MNNDCEKRKKIIGKCENCRILWAHAKYVFLIDGARTLLKKVQFQIQTSVSKDTGYRRLIILWSIFRSFDLLCGKHRRFPSKGIVLVFRGNKGQAADQNYRWGSGIRNSFPRKDFSELEDFDFSCTMLDVVFVQKHIPFRDSILFLIQP